MTAEIAVLNKSAVALAADSAVSISDGNGSTKVYNGAEKLFALTKFHPVGIMIYGTGSLCQVPWELIVKEYRKKIKEDSFDTLEAYAEDFFQFLATEPKLIPMELREHFIRQHWNFVYTQLWELVESKVRGLIEDTGQDPTPIETFNIFDSEAAEITKILHENNFLNNFDADDVRTIQMQAKEFLVELINSSHQDSDFPPQSIEIAAEVLALATAKENPLGSNSGIVFAGYGNKEFFPSVLAFNLKGFWSEKLRVIPNSQKSAVAGSSGIQAYAQDEEALTFMHGISPRLKSDIVKQFQRLFQEILFKSNQLINDATIGDGEKELLRETLVNTAQQQWDETIASIERQIRSQYTDQVVDMVEFLPKDELAYMAESLVNMTAFKRKVTNDTETVGGPIDVAIISKGDGFVWIKRKHYFDSALNTHYFDNFLKGKSNVR